MKFSEDNFSNSRRFICSISCNCEHLHINDSSVLIGFAIKNED